MCVVTGLTVTSLPCDTDPAKAAMPRREQMLGMDLLAVSAVWKAEAQLPSSMTRLGHRSESEMQLSQKPLWLISGLNRESFFSLFKYKI